MGLTLVAHVANGAPDGGQPTARRVPLGHHGRQQRAQRIRQPPARRRDGGGDAVQQQPGGDEAAGRQCPGGRRWPPARRGRRRRGARWCRTPARTGVPRCDGQPVGQVGDGGVGVGTGGPHRVQQDRLVGRRCRQQSAGRRPPRRRRRRCRGSAARTSSIPEASAASATASGTSIRAWNASVNSNGTTTARSHAGRGEIGRRRLPGRGRSGRGTRPGSRRRTSERASRQHQRLDAVGHRGVPAAVGEPDQPAYLDLRQASGQHETSRRELGGSSCPVIRARRSAGLAVRRVASGSAGRTSSARAGRDRCAGSSW